MRTKAVAFLNKCKERRFKITPVDWISIANPFYID